MMIPSQEQRLPCTCGHCPRPLKGSAFLLPRILSSGRQWQKNCCLCLEVTGLPDHLPPPLTLCHVTAEDTHDWEMEEDGCGRCASMVVAIPLKCCVRDGCGGMHTGHACITSQVPWRNRCGSCDTWRSRMVILPSVRLTSPSCPAPCPVFDARLEVLTEVYLTRWEPVCSSSCDAPPQELPLYPPPCHPY